MPESKSGALTSLAIPLRELAACRHFNYIAVASTGKILFYNSLICKSDFIGCFVSDLAFHAIHFAGTCFSTCSASCSVENAQNTHAPEPVILAAP
jgi:hypothetical protein